MPDELLTAIREAAAESARDESELALANERLHAVQDRLRRRDTEREARRRERADAAAVPRRTEDPSRLTRLRQSIFLADVRGFLLYLLFLVAVGIVGALISWLLGLDTGTCSWPECQ